MLRAAQALGLVSRISRRNSAVRPGQSAPRGLVTRQAIGRCHGKDPTFALDNDITDVCCRRRDERDAPGALRCCLLVHPLAQNPRFSKPAPSEQQPDGPIAGRR